MSVPFQTPSIPLEAAHILQAHQLYCQLTGQSLRLGFDRERMWLERRRLGYDLGDLRAVITYLQRELRAQRRNVGALKLSNLLQPDRFQEALQISRVRLRTPAPPPAARPASPALSPRDWQRTRQRALECLRQIKAPLRQLSTDLNPKNFRSQTPKTPHPNAPARPTEHHLTACPCPTKPIGKTSRKKRGTLHQNSAWRRPFALQR